MENTNQPWKAEDRQYLINNWLYIDWFSLEKTLNRSIEEMIEELYRAGEIKHKNVPRKPRPPRHPIYDAYYTMITRCYNPKNKDYKNYGARGIKICPSWLKDKQVFFKWALKNGWNKGLSIDRINNNGPYSPKNCRWTDMKTQNRNRRNNHMITYNGKNQCVAELAEELGIKYSVLYSRIKKSMSIEEAINK